MRKGVLFLLLLLLVSCGGSDVVARYYTFGGDALALLEDGKYLYVVSLQEDLLSSFAEREGSTEGEALTRLFGIEGKVTALDNENLRTLRVLERALSRECALEDGVEALFLVRKELEKTAFPATLERLLATEGLWKSLAHCKVAHHFDFSRFGLAGEVNVESYVRQWLSCVRNAARRR